MTTVLLHIFATVVPTVAGFCLLGLLRWPGLGGQRSWPEQIGLSYLFGLFLIAIEINLFGLLGLPLSLAALLVAQLVPTGLFGLRLATSNPRLSYQRPRLTSVRWLQFSDSWWKWILAALICLKLVYVLSMNLTELRRTDDAFTWQLSLSKHTYFESDHSGFVMERGYPKTPGLALTWFALAHGSWNEFAVNLCFFNYFAVLLLLFYANLRALVGTNAALCGTYLLSAQPLLANHAILIGYADLPLAVFLCLTGVYAFRFARDGQADDLIVSGAFALCLPLIKLEGQTPYLFIAAYTIAAAFVYQKQRLSPGKIWGATCALIVLAIAAVGVMSFTYGDGGPPFLQERLWYRIRPGNHLDQIGAPLLDHFFQRHGNWIIVGTLSALSLPLLSAVFWRRVEMILGLYGMLMVVAFLYLFCVGGAYEFLVNGTTVNRSFLQIMPTILFTATVMIARLPGFGQPE